MNKRETQVVTIVLGAGIPLLLLILFWWIGAGLVISKILIIKESGIPVIAMTGLAFGVALDALYLKRWVPRIYEISPWVMVPIYLFASLIMLAFFMGLPLGNLALGTFVGVYFGRRAKYSGEGKDLFAKSTKKTSIFTALVTAGESFPFALLSLDEPIVQDLFGAIGGLDGQATAGWVGVTLMILVIICVAFLQFWCTSRVARFAYRGKTTDGIQVP